MIKRRIYLHIFVTLSLALLVFSFIEFWGPIYHILVFCSVLIYLIFEVYELISFLRKEEVRKISILLLKDFHTITGKKVLCGINDFNFIKWIKKHDSNFEIEERKELVRNFRNLIKQFQLRLFFIPAFSFMVMILMVVLCY